MTSGTRRSAWYHGWNIVAASIVASIVTSALTINTFTLFLHQWATEFHTSVSTLTLALAAMAPTAAIGSPIVGSLADKYPTRWLFGAGLGLLALFYIAMSFVTAPWMIIALYATAAPIALCLATTVPANALITRWFVHRRGLALGLSSFGLGMGGILLPPVIAAILPIASWQMIWRVSGVFVGVVVLPIVMLVIRERPSERDGLHYLQGEAAAVSHHGGGGDSSLRFRDIVTRRTFWILVLTFLPLIGLHGAAQQNLGPYAVNHGFDQGVGGVLLSTLSVTQVLATLVMGLLSDRFGNRRPLIGLALVVAAGSGLLALGSSLPIIIVGCALVGSAFGIFPIIAAALADEFGAGGVGRAFGLLMLFLPAIAPSAFLLARIQETTGSYGPAFLVFAVLVLIAAVLCLFLRERGALHASSTAQVASEHGT